MTRIALANGIIIPALLAVLPGCEDSFVCHGFTLDCGGGVCIDPTTDNHNCGACGTECGPGTHCEAMSCTADVVTCTPACGPFADCVGTTCTGPLATIETVKDDGGGVVTGRDLFVLHDVNLTLTQIVQPALAGDRVVDHAILPDGSLLLVAAHTDGVVELWKAPVGGGELVKVSGTLVTGGNVLPGIVVSRDGKRVLYRADQDVDGEIDLYEVAIADPGASHRVNGTLSSGGQVSSVFALSADGTRAAYVATEETDTYDAYTVDLSGATPGPSVRLDPAGVSDIWDLQMTGDGGHVVYRRYDPNLGRLALHVIDTADPGVEHEVTYADGGEGHVEGYRITPDDTAVVFTGSRITYEESLWRAPLATPDATVRLVDGTDGGTGQDWVRPDFVISHDGASVFFRKVSGAFGFDRLFRVDVALPEVSTQLSPFGDDSSKEVTDFVLADDEHSIVYRGGADGAEGGNPQPGTSDPLPFDGRAPALYHIDLAETAPPTPVALGPAVVAGHDGIYGGYVVSRDGRRTIFRADHDQIGAADAYLTLLDTAGTARKVSPPLDQTSDATDVSRLGRF